MEILNSKDATQKIVAKARHESSESLLLKGFVLLELLNLNANFFIVVAKSVSVVLREGSKVFYEFITKFIFRTFSQTMYFAVIKSDSPAI